MVSRKNWITVGCYVIWLWKLELLTTGIKGAVKIYYHLHQDMFLWVFFDIDPLLVPCSGSTQPIAHTPPFNGPLSETTWVSRYQKGETNLDFTEVRDSEWQWH